MQVCSFLAFLAFALQTRSQIQYLKKKLQKDSHLNSHLLCMTISAQSQQQKSWERVGSGVWDLFFSFHISQDWTIIYFYLHIHQQLTLESGLSTLKMLQAHF